MFRIKEIIVLGLLVLIINGCCCVTPRVETVIDREYVPKQCPIFRHKFSVLASKFDQNESYNGVYVVIPTKQLINDVEKNNYIVDVFNENIIKSNESYIVRGKPETSNYKIVHKRIFVDRACPKFKYAFTIKAKKLKKKNDLNSSYAVISLDKFIDSLEKNRFARETYNKNIDAINDGGLTQKIKNKFDLVVEKINSN